MVSKIGDILTILLLFAIAAANRINDFNSGTFRINYLASEPYSGSQEFLTPSPHTNAIKLAQVIDMPGEVIEIGSL